MTPQKLLVFAVLDRRFKQPDLFDRDKRKTRTAKSLRINGSQERKKGKVVMSRNSS